MNSPKGDIPQRDMKLRVAHTIKWNAIDKILTQALYALTGVILAKLLSQADFGLVGTILIFQAFATLFVDSGFAYALIQRKSPTDLDYSTVFWFNLGVATLLYIGLFAAAPWIADIFKGDQRLVPLSRVMFLTFIINASAIVQTNRLVKRMDVKMIAVSNSLGLVASAVVGIWLAVAGYGAWAIVWQSIALAATKSAILWATSKWRPMVRFSWAALKSFFGVGSSVMATSFLNVLFQNIYGFFISNRLGMVAMGYYHQADKWSKMGVASLSGIMTQSFLPALSHYQNDAERFASLTAKMNRFTSYVTFPCIGMLIAMSHPIFHALFGTKWDPSIILFQLLLIRGIFTIFSALYHNYFLSLGHSRLLVATEALRDGAAVLAIIATIPYLALSSDTSPTEGIAIFLWGQVAASALTWAITLVMAARKSRRSAAAFVVDMLPYLAETIIAVVAMLALKEVLANPWLLLLAQGCVGCLIYFGLNAALHSKIQQDALNFVRGRKMDI